MALLMILLLTQSPLVMAQQTPAGQTTQAALKQGVLNCTSRINPVSNFLGFGPQAGAVLMMPPSQPDQRLIPLAMEVPTEGGSAYVSAANTDEAEKHEPDLDIPHKFDTSRT